MYRVRNEIEGSRLRMVNSGQVESVLIRTLWQSSKLFETNSRYSAVVRVVALFYPYYLLSRLYVYVHIFIVYVYHTVGHGG